MQKTIRAVRGPIQVELSIPGSRFITHRAIFLSALAEGVSELSGLNVNSAAKALLKALHQLGIVTQLDENAKSCIIAGCNGKFPKKQATVWCENFLFLARWLLAACALTPGVYYIDGSNKLREKNFHEYLNLLRRQGTQFIPADAHKMPLTLVGTDSLEGGQMMLYTTNHHLLSSFLLISPYARTPFTINAPKLAHESIVDITCAMMAEFGVLVHRIHQGQFMIPVPQRYQARDYTVEPDISIAVYFFAAAAIMGGELRIQAIKRAVSKQPNIKFLAVLESMGCQMREYHNSFLIKSPKELEGIEVSMREFNDTFLALLVIAPFAKSPTRISHISKPSAKERQSMEMMRTELTKMNIEIEMADNWIKVFPSSPKGGIVNTYNDAHIGMAFSILGLKVPGIIIDDIEPVMNHCPEFYNLLDKIPVTSNINA